MLKVSSFSSERCGRRRAVDIYVGWIRTRVYPYDAVEGGKPTDESSGAESAP